NITTVAGNHGLGTGFSGDSGKATNAQLDTPDGVAIAPDGDLIIADSHNDRIRRVDKPTGVITTVAGSGDNGYDGDDKPATDAALNTPSAVACAPNGDIYIADTLNKRVRMIDVKTGLIPTVAGDGATATPEAGDIGDNGPATSAKLFMPSDVAVDSRTGDVYIADMHHYRVRKVDARTHIITTVAGNGNWQNTGDDGPALQASFTGPAGVALMPEGDGKLTIFIADYYSGHVRAAGLMQRRLVPWTLSFLRPYRRRVALLSVLLLLEIGLGALQPWPLKIVIDYVLGGHPFPPALAGWMTWLTRGNQIVLLVAVVI